MANTLPTVAGYYWAKWRIAEKGTPQGEEMTYYDEWQVVEAFVNLLDEYDPEHLRVHVPGVSISQSLGNFFWEPGPLNPPANGETDDLLPAALVRFRA